MWCCNGHLNDEVVILNTCMVSQLSGKGKQLQLLQQQVRRDCMCVFPLCIDASK